MDGRSKVGRDPALDDAAADAAAFDTAHQDHATLVDATDWPAERWDRLAVWSPAGHAFQSHAWGELKRPLGWTPQRFVVELRGQPVAAVSFQERNLAPRLPGPLGKRTYLYVPRGPILLEDSAAAARAALDGLRALARKRRAAILTIDPAWPPDGPVAAELSRAGFRPAARDVQVSRTATLVPLLADEAEQHRLVRKSTANLINRARRERAAAERIELANAQPADRDRALGEMHDLLAAPPRRGGAGGGAERIELANAQPADRDRALGEMHDLLVATARREGIVLRGRDYQLAQWRGPGEAGIAWLWFGGVGKRRWTGSLLLRCGGTLHQYQAGSADDADLRAVPANHLLQWEIVRWAAAAGFKHYDLGGVDARNARGLPRDDRHPPLNLYLFKRGFGAEGVEFVRAHEYAPNPFVRAAWRLARRLR